MRIAGGRLDDELAHKMEEISQLIGEVEETQEAIVLIAEQPSISARFTGTGSHHFRHTEITKPLETPVVDRIRG
jgi:hypothetical protein